MRQWRWIWLGGALQQRCSTLATVRPGFLSIRAMIQVGALWKDIRSAHVAAVIAPDR
jgi:hypothetical protein